VSCRGRSSWVASGGRGFQVSRPEDHRITCHGHVWTVLSCRPELRFRKPSSYCPPPPHHPIPFFSIPELISIVYSAFLFRLHLHDQNRPNQNGSPKTAIPSRSPRFPNRRDPMRRTSRYSRQRVHRHPPPHVLLRSVLQLQRSGGEEEALRDQRREHTYRLEHIVGRRSQGARRAA
jgi:hypothetical protein